MVTKLPQVQSVIKAKGEQTKTKEVFKFMQTFYKIVRFTQVIADKKNRS